MHTIDEVKNYLEDYQEHGTELDEIFRMFKDDVFSLAKAYRQGEAYLYTKQDYIDFMTECEADQDIIDDLKDRPFSIAISVSGLDEAYTI